MNADQAILHGWPDGEEGPAESNPLATLLAMRIVSMDRAGKSIALGFTPPPATRTADGSLNRVAIASMLDFACGYVAMVVLVPTRTVASSTLRIEWVNDSKADVVTATGRIQAFNETTAFTRAELLDERGAVIALATSALRILATRA